MFKLRPLSLVFFLLTFSLTTVAQAQTQPATVETIQFQSKLTGKTLPFHVLLPSAYALPESRSTRFPVLYLLHGLTGHYTDWVKNSQITQYAARHRFIIVTPEGENSWYTDSPVVPTEKFESYVMQELIPEVQKRYRTIESRSGRAIAGLSMGGYGALKFGVKYPETFYLAASMSGAVGAAQFKIKDLGASASGELPANLPPFIKTVVQSVNQAFGPEGGPTRNANDLFQLVRDLPEARIKELPFLYLDCGTEDSLIKSNKELSDILLTRKIPHESRELPGIHNWPYWDGQIREVLDLVEARLPQAAAEKAAR